MKAGIMTWWFVTVSEGNAGNTESGSAVQAQAGKAERPGAPADGNRSTRVRTTGVLTCRKLGATLAVLAIMVCADAPQARGQATNEVEELKRQLQQLQENFERMQREQRQQIEALTRKLDDLTKQQAAEAEKKKLEQELATELEKKQPTPAAPSTTPAPSAAWSPAQPLTVARAGSAYMNISFDALMDVGGSTASNPSQFLATGRSRSQHPGLFPAECGNRA